MKQQMDYFENTQKHYFLMYQKYLHNEVQELKGNIRVI